MRQTPVTDSYILGIKEGRSFLRNNPDLTNDDMLQLAINAADNRSRHAQPMKDLFKGEQDFWRGQLNKKS